MADSLPTSFLDISILLLCVIKCVHISQDPQSALTAKPASSLLLWAPLHPPPAPAPCVLLANMASPVVPPPQLQPARPAERARILTKKVCLC